MVPVSLVLGLIMIGTGVYIAFNSLVNWTSEIHSDEDLLLIFVIFIVPFFVVGGLLLRKYDKDRKKEKNS